MTLNLCNIKVIDIWFMASKNLGKTDIESQASRKISFQKRLMGYIIFFTLKISAVPDTVQRLSDRTCFPTTGHTVPAHQISPTINTKP